MNGNTPMRVLVVDDVNSVLDGVIAYFREAGERLGVTAEILFAPSVEEVEGLLDDGKRFDVSLVDFGLGAGQPSGLSALELLHRDGAGGNIAVHADMDNTQARLLLGYAAFQWFPTTVALIPKTYAVKGATFEERAENFVRSAIGIGKGRAPHPDRAASFRKPGSQIDNYFSQLIRSSLDVRNFKLMKQFNSFAEAANAAHFTTGVLSNWGTEKRPILELFLRQASENSELTGMQVAPITAHSGGHTTAAIISQFANAQSLFFDDPEAERHFAV